MAVPEMGVYYAASDYVGFFRRTLIDLVDGIVLVVAWAIGIIAIRFMPPSTQPEGSAAIFYMLAVAFVYLVVLKRYARTLGYLLAGARIVNMQGQSPSLIAMSVRAVFLFIGPGNTLLDLFWLTSDRDRQAIRDKFAKTYVIRDSAQPAGSGAIRYIRMDLLGYMLLLPEVTRA
jgi:uncharacterized RDD family membrane protein YckC